MGRDPREAEIPQDLRAQAKNSTMPWSRKLPNLMMILTVKFLEDEEISTDEMKAAFEKL